MNCYYCSGQLEPSTTETLLHCGEWLLVLKGVPCDQCKQCGEGYFTTKTMAQLEEIKEKLVFELSKDSFVNFDDVAS